MIESPSLPSGGHLRLIPPAWPMRPEPKIIIIIMAALNKYLDVSPEVAQALAAGRPVVALESTIISHGMPLSPKRGDLPGCGGHHP